MFWISPVRISNPLSRVLMLSNPWWSETDCHGWTGGGSPPELEEWACLVHAVSSTAYHLDPLASCGCGVWSQAEWYPGVNPDVFSAGNHSAWYAWGTTGKGDGCSCCELPASFLALLCVILPDIELLHASSRGSRAKVSSWDLYKQRFGLGNEISFVYPGKKNTSFLASLYFKWCPCNK
jgi:hypothetical protein